jgi:hypothetical protein
MLLSDLPVLVGRAGPLALDEPSNERQVHGTGRVGIDGIVKSFTDGDGEVE